jgi:hypothetical protein
MKCPHCNTGIHEGFVTAKFAEYHKVVRNGRVAAPAEVWSVLHQRCPECSGMIIQLGQFVVDESKQHRFPVHPSSVTRPIPTEVEPPYSTDFKEACAVLPYSAKASAALSRRNLQAVLRDKAKTTKKDLYDQIEEVSSSLPGHIAESLHAVRTIGNIAAHSMKSTNTSEIMDVALGEADWNLDVLESLFDFYFVQPVLAAKRKAALNEKLKAAGKAEL